MKKILTLCLLLLVTVCLSSCTKLITISVDNANTQIKQNQTLETLTPPTKELEILDYWLVNGEKKDNSYILQPNDKVTSVLRAKSSTA